MPGQHICLQGGQPVNDANPFPVKAAAGTALMGKVGIDQTTPGDTNKVSESTGFKNTAASVQVKAGAGALLGFMCNSSTAGTAKLWDALTATGTVIINTMALTAGTFYPVPCRFSTGLFFTLGGTADVTFFYD